jgi:hypothetical protein
LIVFKTLHGLSVQRPNSAVLAPENNIVRCFRVGCRRVGRELFAVPFINVMRGKYDKFAVFI